MRLFVSHVNDKLKALTTKEIINIQVQKVT